MQLRNIINENRMDSVPKALLLVPEIFVRMPKTVTEINLKKVTGALIMHYKSAKKIFKNSLY